MILPISVLALALAGAAQELIGTTPAAAQAFAELHRWNVQAMLLGAEGAEKARSPEVRRYAELLGRERALCDVKLSDHARGRFELRSPAAEPWEQARLAGLRSSAGEDFDREFLAASVEAGRKALDALQEARASVVGEEREVIERLAPLIEQHHRLASTLSAGR